MTPLTKEEKKSYYEQIFCYICKIEFGYVDKNARKFNLQILCAVLLYFPV